MESGSVLMPASLSCMSESVARMSSVRNAGHGERIGREVQCHERVEFAREGVVGQRIALVAQRIRLDEHAAAYDGARPAVELCLGRGATT